MGRDGGREGGSWELRRRGRKEKRGESARGVEEERRERVLGVEEKREGESGRDGEGWIEGVRKGVRKGGEGRGREGKGEGVSE